MGILVGDRMDTEIICFNIYKGLVQSSTHTLYIYLYVNIISPILR